MHITLDHLDFIAQKQLPRIAAKAMAPITVHTLIPDSSIRPTPEIDYLLDDLRIARKRGPYALCYELTRAASNPALSLGTANKAMRWLKRMAA